jgi:hypothetical protein
MHGWFRVDRNAATAGGTPNIPGNLPTSGVPE